MRNLKYENTKAYKLFSKAELWQMIELCIAIVYLAAYLQVPHLLRKIENLTQLSVPPRISTAQNRKNTSRPK